MSKPTQTQKIKLQLKRKKPKEEQPAIPAFAMKPNLTRWVE